MLAIKPRKDGNGVLVVTPHGHAKKVEGLSHVRYGKKFLTITNKKLFPLKTITIYEGYDSPSIGYTRFIYDGEPVIPRAPAMVDISSRACGMNATSSMIHPCREIQHREHEWHCESRKEYRQGV